jgi:thiamine-phosphate pyrophosphorylase
LLQEGVLWSLDYSGGMAFLFPRIYPILDSATIPAAGREEFLRRLGSELAEAGVTLLEYRNKKGRDEEILADAAILRAAMPAPNIKLILNDRVDLVERTNFDGVHVDAGDVSPDEARRLLGPARIIGTFGGPADAGGLLLPGVLQEPADYFAIGPVFPTQTKETGKSPIGAEGVRRLRAQAGPGPVLTAAGGIMLGSAAEILNAGATSVAVSAAIFRVANPAAEFRRWVMALA